MTSQSTSTSLAPADPSASGVARPTITLLSLAALAWAGSIAYARHMGDGSGTIGMAFGAFLAVWVGMMTAMMLPAVAPVAARYAPTITTNRTVRRSLFVLGYLLVWAAIGMPVYGVLRVVDHAVGDSDTIMRNIAVGILIGAGVYQLSALKSRFLFACRSPLAEPLRNDDLYSHAWRDLEVGAQHGLSCLACSWALMALFIAFGVMNPWAMAALAAVIVGERLLPRGIIVARGAGASCLILAVLVLASPWAADTFVPTAGSMPHLNMTHM